jgi:DNA polymerase
VEQDEASKKAIVVQALGVTRSALSSNPQMATMLRGLGVEPPIKKSPTTGKDTFAFAATDMEFDALLSHEDEKVRDLVRGRLVIKSTIEETRAARFLKVHELFGGRMPVFLNYAGASQTNRLSGGGKLNQQNVGRGSRLRNAIHAPHGYVLVVADLSNIELRVNMTASNETVLRDKLAAGEDLYCLFAAGVYNRPVTKADKTERQVGKVAELSLGYAAGDATFRQMLFAQADMTVPLSFASQVVQTYRYSKPNLGVSWNNFKTWIDAMCMGSTVQSWLDAPVELHKDGMLLHGGFKIKYPDMRKEAVIDVNGSTQYKTRYTRYTGKASKGRCSLWHGMVNENCAQALARIVLADIQDNVAAQTGVLPVLQVHDELIYCVPEAMGDGLLESVLAEMHRRRPWWPSLPLAGEGGVGYRYGEIK